MPEAISGRCAVPPDDPRTPFNETSFFNTTLGYLDYVGWSALMGQLSALYPHLVALQVCGMVVLLCLSAGSLITACGRLTTCPTTSSRRLASSRHPSLPK